MFFMLANLTIIKHHKQSCVLWSSNHLVLGLQTVRFPFCNCLKVSPSSKLEPWEGTRLSGRVVIRVCLKMGYTPNYSHLVGIMIINHWVYIFVFFAQRTGHVEAAVWDWRGCLDAWLLLWDDGKLQLGHYRRPAWYVPKVVCNYRNFDTAFMRFSRLWKEHGPCFIFESLLTFECQKGHDEPRWTRIMLRLCSRNQDDGFNKVMQHWQWLLISGSCGLCLMSPLWNDNPNRLFRMCLKPTTRLQTVPCECIVTIHDLHEQTQIPSDWDSLSLQILTPPLTVFFFKESCG